jgi:hypothetical protein
MKPRLKHSVRILVGALLLLLAFNVPSWALNSANFSVVRTSSPYFQFDSNSPMTSGPKAAYVCIEVKNISGTTQSGLYLKLSSIFSLNTALYRYTLLGPSDSTVVIGTLAAGQSKICYYYVKYDVYTNTNSAFGTAGTANCTVNFSLNDRGSTSSLSYTFNWYNRKSISANAGGLTTNTVVNQDIVGGKVYDTVRYTIGNAQAGDEVNIEIARDANFDANKLQLVGIRILFSNEPGISAGSTDSTYFRIASPGGGTGGYIRVLFTFQIKASNFSTTLSPYAGTTSGASNYKYAYDPSNGSATVTVSSTANKLTLSKSVSSATSYKNGIVTYTVTMGNSSSTYGIIVDQLVDILPTAYSYQGLNGASQVTSTNSSTLPTVGSTGTMTFIGGSNLSNSTCYYIAPSSTLKLMYDVQVKNSLSTSDTNKVNAYVAGSSMGYAFAVCRVIAMTAGSISADQTICYGTDASLLNSITAATGAPTITYQWQSSTDSIRFSSITGATAITYDPSLIYANTFYRRKAIDGNNDTSVSNVIKITVNALPTATIRYSDTIFSYGNGYIYVIQTGTSGGTYFGSTGLIIDGSTGRINLNETLPGTYTAYYSFSNGSCSNITSVQLRILAPVLAIEKIELRIDEQQLNWKLYGDEKVLAWEISSSEDAYQFAAETILSSDRSSYILESSAAKAFYRVGAKLADGSVIYSNVIAKPIASNVSVLIFPNPASDYLQIQNATNTSMQIRLINSNGLEVLFAQMTAQTNSIDVRDYPRGNYILQLITPIQSTYKQIILQ